MKAPAAHPDVILRELPPIGKYRVRILADDKGKPAVLDLREYVTGRDFEGYTRRGIRIPMEIRSLTSLLEAAQAALEVTR